MRIPHRHLSRGNAFFAEESPRGERVIQRRREGLFRREPIFNRQRSCFGCRSGFGNQAAMAEDRSRPIAAP
jgi:hypothetical protein